MNQLIELKLQISDLKERLNTTPCKTCLELLDKLKVLENELQKLREIS